jgi:integrase
MARPHGEDPPRGHLQARSPLRRRLLRRSGGQRKQAARTLDEARKLKAARTAHVARGDFHTASREKFRDYAEAWVERYTGTGRKGFRESTRDDYRRLVAEFAYPYFRNRRLTEITPSDIAGFIGWLCDAQAQGRPLSDSTVRNILNPVRSCFATAVLEGRVLHNPTTGAALPHRHHVRDEDGEEVKALTREQLAAFLAVVHPRHRTMFRVLAATRLRVWELLALQWRHLRLDGSEPCARVRRALAKGWVEPPRTKYGRRDVPLDPELVSELRSWRKASEWAGEEDLVFPSHGNAAHGRESAPSRPAAAAEEAGASWAGFHTFRHTCASMLFEGGKNAKQVQTWLGHHSPCFTVDNYVHLLRDGPGEPLDLASELSEASGDQWQIAQGHGS